MLVKNANARLRPSSRISSQACRPAADASFDCPSRSAGRSRTAVNSARNRVEQLAVLLVDRTDTTKLLVVLRNFHHPLSRHVLAAQHVLQKRNHIVRAFRATEGNEQKRIVRRQVSVMQISWVVIRFHTFYYRSGSSGNWPQAFVSNRKPVRWASKPVDFFALTWATGLEAHRTGSDVETRRIATGLEAHRTACGLASLRDASDTFPSIGWERNIMPTAIPAEIKREVLAPMGVASVEPLPAGMSGASVFRCQFPSGRSELLKQWPPGTSAERVAEVDRVIVHSRDHGCRWTPGLAPIGRGGETHRVVQQACWQMMDWIPGQPLPANAPLQLIESSRARRLPRFHASVADLGVVTQSAPAVIGATSRRVRELTPRSPSSWRWGRMPCLGLWNTENRLTRALHQARQLVIWKWDEVADRITRSLNRYASEPLHDAVGSARYPSKKRVVLRGQPKRLDRF